jgi:NhaA family Na+:H+ antiporter
MNIPARSYGSVKTAARRSYIARRVVLPVQAFLHTEGLGSAVLLGAALVALAWSNSPWRASYEALWRTPVALEIGGFGLRADLRHVIDDGLMAIFFFVVAMEIKRELVEGDLSSPRRAALPVVAALGGMIVPALIYTALNAGGPSVRGWGVPMATDIAFAVGVVLMLGDRVPPAVRTFLLALAVADDLGAIVVIAVFYTKAISLPMLGLAAALVGVLAIMRRLRIRAAAANVPVGLMLWAALFQSGVHATVAGVILGLMMETRPWFSLYAFSDSMRKFHARFRRALDRGNFDHAETLMGQLEELGRGTEPPLDRQFRLIHPWSSFVILPLFALANSGVTLSGDLLSSAATSRLAWGIALGLAVGKPVGVIGFAWLATRLRWATLPKGVTWRHITTAGLLAGIGFTVSLFVAELAFEDPKHLAEAKVVILAASLFSGLAGYLWSYGAETQTEDTLVLGRDRRLPRAERRTES